MNIYIVKKNPEINDDPKNMIIMNQDQFNVFAKSKEGKRRKSSFLRLSSCSTNDSVIYIEASEVKERKKIKSDLNHEDYAIQIKKNSGLSEISYDHTDFEDGDIDAILNNAFMNQEGFEDEVCDKVVLQQLGEYINESFSSIEKEALYVFFLAENKNKALRVFMKRHRDKFISRQGAVYWKHRVIEKMRDYVGIE